jgi:hypothetical protein
LGDQSGDFVGKIKNDTSVHRKSTIENVILSAPLFMEMKMIRLQRKPLNPDSEGGRQLEIVETLYKIILFQNDGFTFGGLIGEDRNQLVS